MRRLDPLPWILAATVWVGFVQPASASPQGFAESTDVVVVEVPVQVVRDGQPVRGLTAADFEVYDGRKRVEITGFEVLDLDAPGSKRARLPASARRHFLLLFDLAFSDPKSVVRAREAARDLVLQGLRPEDLAAVATYSAGRGPQLVLGFTSDRRQIDAALDTLGVVPDAERPPDPLRLVIAQRDATPRPADTRSAVPSRHAGRAAEASLEAEAARNEALLSELGSMGMLGERASTASQQAAVTAFARSFADLGKLMGSVLGRKYVVFLSEGFNNSLVTGISDAKEREELSRSTLEGESWEASSEDVFGDTKSLNDIEKMLESFRRADCVIQAVDIGGLRAAGAGAADTPGRTGGRDSLFQMARGTGGELVENANDLSAAMEGMLRRTGVTYVLSFQPEKLKRDGAYRKLRVELKGAPRGTRVTHRPGYFAPKPYAEMTSLERLLETASQITGGEERGSIAAALLAAPFRVAGETAYVPVVIEVDGPGLLAGARGATLPAEIYVYALDETGAIHDFLAQSFGLEMAKAGPALQQSGLKFFGHLDLPPGRYSIRALVRNGLTGAYSLRVAPVEVPVWSDGRPVLLPPFLPEPPGRWLMVRETQKPGAPQVPYPFLQKGQPYIPASKPTLAGGQETPVALVGYNWGTGELQAEAKILTRDGREAGAGEIRLLAREGGGAAGADRIAAGLRLPKLQPGEYTLRVTLTDGTGTSQTSATAFVIK
jgi:VWFA-related protein